MSIKDLPTISEIGSHLDGEPLRHPKQLRSTPKEKPAAEVKFPSEYHPFPTTFSMHDNRYDSDSVQSGSVVANPKTTGDDNEPAQKVIVLPNELVVPSLPPMPTQTSNTIPSNDVLAAVIARVTQQTIACLSKTKSLKEIEAAATAAAVESFRKMSTPTKASVTTDGRDQEEVPYNHDSDSDINSYSDEEIDPITGKVGKPRNVRIFRRVRINEHLAILVVNGHTGNNSRRPIIDLGELFIFFLKHGETVSLFYTNIIVRVFT